MDVPVASHAPAPSAEVSAADVLAAQARLRRYLEPTPTHYAERFGCWLKLENLQRTGSYKVRGALNALLAMRERCDERTVVTASAGNHAQGLAWAAYCLNVPVVTVMPQPTPQYEHTVRTAAGRSSSAGPVTGMPGRRAAAPMPPMIRHRGSGTFPAVFPADHICCTGWRGGK